MAPVLPTKLSPCLQPSPAPKRDITIKIATAAAAAAAAAAATVSFTLTAKSAGWAPLVHSSSSAPQFADIAMIFDTTISLDPRIRAAFDTTSSSDDCLLHVGLVKKDGGFGRPSKVYAFGVYADGNDLKQQLKQYQSSSLSELKKNAELMNDVLERDIGMTVRLMTVEGGLSIREISSKISKLVEARLRKLDGQEKLVLQRFVSLLKDEYKLLNASIIDFSRKPGHVLKISIDGNEVGRIQSKLLCKSVLYIYVGENALDKKAKDIIQEKIARLLMCCWT